MNHQRVLRGSLAIPMRHHQHLTRLGTDRFQGGCFSQCGAGFLILVSREMSFWHRSTPDARCRLH